MEALNQVMFFADTAQQPGGGIIGTLIMFGAMFAIFYFILIRPQQKQQKKHQAMLLGLKRGDEVILASGIIGKVASVEDKVVFIEIGDKTKIKVLKQAVTTIVSNQETESEIKS